VEGCPEGGYFSLKRRNNIGRGSTRVHADDTMPSGGIEYVFGALSPRVKYFEVLSTN
jgi:hypothetical protein